MQILHLNLVIIQKLRYPTYKYRILKSSISVHNLHGDYVPQIKKQIILSL